MKNNKETLKEVLSEKKEAIKTVMKKEEKNNLYSFYFTHSEDALDAIDSILEKHPKVKSVSQNSGFWYSNGETGPEWFSMDVTCLAEEVEEIQNFIREKLKQKNFSYKHINFIQKHS